MYDLAIINGKVWIDEAFHRLNIYVLGGKIACLSASRFEASEVINATNEYVIPGIIDPHVHFALGTGERRSKDDFLSGSIAAAFGGVTTIIDFLDPSRNVDELNQNYLKRCNEAKECAIDYQFHATLREPNQSLEDFVFRMEQLHLKSLKIFTTYSDSHRRTDDDAIKTLLKLTTYHPFILIGHVENDQLIDLNPDYPFQLLPLSRPVIAETEEAMKIAGFVKETGGTFYMVHLTSGETIEKIKAKYPDLINQKFLIESCPHYFVFTEDALSKSDGYLYTMAPPLRTKNDQLKLKNNIDYINTIGTDHCSYDITLKHKTLLNQMPLGIGGIEHSFSIMHSMFGDKIIDKMTKNVASIYQLPTKGLIKTGMDADFCFYEMTPPFTIRDSHSAADNDIYLGMRVTTKVVRTVLRGKIIVQNSRFIPHQGMLIKGVD